MILDLRKELVLDEKGEFSLEDMGKMIEITKEFNGEANRVEAVIISPRQAIWCKQLLQSKVRSTEPQKVVYMVRGIRVFVE